MNIEEIKIALLKTFRKKDNKAVDGFLREFCNPENHPRYAGAKIYQPIYFPLQRLSVQVTHHTETNNDLSRYDIFFDVQEYPPIGAVEITINERMNSKKNFVNRVGVQGDCVRFGQYHEAYYFDPNYKLMEDSNCIGNEVVFDIVNKNMRCSFGDVEKLLSDLVRHEQKIETSYEDWLSQVEEACKDNLAFAKAAKECALVRLLDPVLIPEISSYYLNSLFLPTLYSYVKCPSVSHLLNHETAFFVYIKFIIRRARHHDDLKRTIDLYLTKGASDICELIGIDNKWASALSYDENSFSFMAIDNFKEKLKRFTKSLHLTDADKLKKVMDLTGFSFKNFPASLFGMLSYMLKIGYDLDTLHAYLSKVDVQQGIDIQEGLSLLFFVARREYAITGNRSPIYPEYLRVKDDLSNREFRKIKELSEKEKYDDSLFLQRLRNNREDLLHEYWIGGFRFVRHEESTDGRSELIAPAQMGRDVVYLEKFSKKNKRLITRCKISLMGDNVLELTGHRSNKEVKRTVLEWAKFHGLLTEMTYGL